MCQTPAKGQTTKRNVHLSVVSVKGIHPMGNGRSAMRHRNLRGDKIRDRTINIRNLISWLWGKSLKLLPPHVTF